MRYNLIYPTVVCVLALASTGAHAMAPKAEWHTVVTENYSGGTSVLDYTVYDSSDTATVSVSQGCPDDNGGYTISGVQYCGQNYQGSQIGGIRTNITKYIRDGDRIRFSMDYKSVSYNGTTFGINPFIEVRRADGTTVVYDLNDAGGTDTWAAYESNETDAISLNENDSVSLVIKNIRGYWHIKNLKIERYGKEDFFGSLNIDGLDDDMLSGGAVTISGTESMSAEGLFAALYSGGELKRTYSIAQDGGAIFGEVESDGADELKIMAWDDSMEPYAESVSVKSDGSGTYRTEAETMKERYKDKFLIGNIYNTKNLYGSDKDILVKHFNAVTAENLMKPAYISPQKGVYNYADTDTFLDFAAENGMAVTAHTLVWHQQSPDWLTSGTADEILSNMREYISNVVGHCKGKVKGWDVVNEALSDGLTRKPTSWEQGLRTDSPWYTGTNDPEYIYNAYVAAHEADPDAELYYNDYNLDNAYKREAAALLVKHINDRYKAENGTDENLITAVGMQSHYHLLTDTDAVRASIKRFREIGVHVNISELDVCLNQVFDNGLGDTSGSVTLTPALEARQAAKYAELMSIYEENADIIDRVTFWGYSDGASWRSAQYPLMFNSDLTPKKAYYAIMKPKDYR